MRPADERFWERIFSGLNHELEWLESAERLKHGADLLFTAYLESCKLSPEERAETEDRNIAGVATLLYGLAPCTDTHTRTQIGLQPIMSW